MADAHRAVQRVLHTATFHVAVNVFEEDNMIIPIKRAWVLGAVGFLFSIHVICPAQADEADLSTQNASGVDARFAAEMAAAEMAGYKRDRDAKVKHLRKALTYRPDHPENLSIEYKIGIELSQRNPPRLAEAMVEFEHVLRTYKHMDYYNANPDDSIDSMQFMMPRAGVHAASIARGPEQNSQKAQEYLWRAMEQLNETYQKRVENWKDAQPPEEDPVFFVFDDEIEEAKRQSLKDFYEQRRTAAANGDVFSDMEMTTVRAAVRQYGYSHGRHRPEVAIVVMREIIDRFPGTPMAKVAQGHIDKAMAMLDQERLDDLADKITYLPPPEPNAATQSTTPSLSSTPPPGRDSQSNAQNPPGLAATITTSLRTHYYAWLAGLAAVVVAVVVALRARKRRT